MHKKSKDCLLKRFQCQHCPAKFASSTEAVHHQRLHAKGKLTYKCKKCHMVFFCRFSFASHTRVHLAEKGLVTKKKRAEDRYRCSKCKASFPSGVGLANHMRIHRRPSLNSSQTKGLLVVASFKCAHCGKCFHSRRSLNNHKRIHVGEKSPSLAPKGKAKTFKCEYCEKTFTSALSLRSHKGMHFTPELHPCPVCSKIFLRNELLSEHLALVHKGRKFKCERCNKSYKTKKTRRQHMKLHTGEAHKESIPQAHKEPIPSRTGNPELSYSYKCGKCHMCFGTYFSLIRHKRVHTGDGGLTSKDTVSVSVVERKSDVEDGGLEQGNTSGCPHKTFPCHSDQRRNIQHNHKGGGGMLNSATKPNVNSTCSSTLAAAVKLEPIDEVVVPVNTPQPDITLKWKNVKPLSPSVPLSPLNHMHKNIAVCDSFKEQKPESHSILKEKPVKCSHCSKSFASVASLRSHRVSHFRPKFGRKKKKPYASGSDKQQVLKKPVKCNRCSKSFASVTSLRSHQVSHFRSKFGKRRRRPSGGRKQQVKCNRCDKILLSLVDVRSHNCATAAVPGQCFQRYKEQSDPAPPGKPFKCDHCEKYFASTLSLRSHKGAHTKFDLRAEPASPATGCNGHHRANVAGKVGPTSGKGKTRHQANVAGKVGPSKTQVLHKTGAKASGGVRVTHQCSLCRKLFPSTRSLHSHKCGPCKFKCRQCSRQFFTSTSLASHKRIHTIRARAQASSNQPKSGSNPKGFACDVCGKLFPLRRYMRVHRIYHFKRSYKCQICSKVWPTIHKLRLHLSSHPGKHFECDVCEARFNRHRTLRYHRSKFHRGKGSPFLSAVERAVQDTASFKSSHRVQGTKRATFECDKIRSLVSHKLVHQKDAKSPGQHDRSESTGSLGRHETEKRLAEQDSRLKSRARDRSVGGRDETHNMQKQGPYKCTFCGREFISYINFCSHIPLHIDQKQSSMIVAVKNVSSPASKPQCKLCKKHFRNSQILQDHMRAIHIYKLPTCHLCQKTFSSHTNLKRHMVVMHSEEKS